MATTRAIVSSPFHITVESYATKHADGSTHWLKDNKESPRMVLRNNRLVHWMPTTMFADLEAWSNKGRQQSAILALAVHSQKTTNITEMDSAIDCYRNQYSAFWLLVFANADEKNQATITDAEAWFFVLKSYGVRLFNAYVWKLEILRLYIGSFIMQRSHFPNFNAHIPATLLCPKFSYPASHHHLKS